MSVMIRSLFISILILLSFHSFAALPATVNGRNIPSLAPLIKQVSPAVVDIVVTGSSSKSNDLFSFLQPSNPSQQFSGLGSGVIIDADKGYIITNYHVIENANQITISLTSGHQYQAKVIGQDPQSDIALLQIHSKQPLVAIKFADSDQIRVGDFTIAIGNPFGLGQTVTSGIISALGRSGLNLQNLENYIQTDAAINSGNSGGALLNLNGELIGINTAILGPNKGNVGIAFAIPANMVKNLTFQLLEFGEIRRGILGIKGGEVTPELAKSFGLKIPYGAFIYQVTANSAADNAGLKAGDVIIAFNGTKVKSFAALRAKIGTLSAGKEILLEVVRDNQSKEVSVILGGNKKNKIITSTKTPILKGATLENSEKNQSLSGVNVVNIKPHSSAYNMGLKQGDVIVAVNKALIHDQHQLLSALDKAQDLRVLNIMRNNRSIYLIMK